MHGIHITALLTTLVAVAVLGPIIHRLRQPADARTLWLAAVIALPLQPLAFYWVRIPLDHWLAAHLGSSSSLYTWLTTLYAPLTEEPAKLVPLLIPAILRDIRIENFVRYALAIGVGFAIGEMWFVADRVAHIPQFAGLPFYQFGGYLGERLMTCVFHSAFVSVSLWCLRSRFILGLMGAATLHWLGNIPIFMMSLNVGGIGKTAWANLIALYLLLYFFAALGLLAKFAFGKVSPARAFYGRRKCPECNAEYEPPLVALNFGHTRYERCPQCNRWHWTKPAVSSMQA